MRVDRLAVAVLAWLLCGPIAGGRPLAAAGDEPASATPVETLRFRRVFIPAERLKDWPRDNVRYVPMDKGEFEPLIERARAGSGGEPQATTAAQYTARLAGDSLVEGEAVLDISPPAAGPSVVWLVPCGLAVAEAAWLGASPQPAVLSVGVDGRLSVRAERRGRLQLKWSLRGRRSATGSVEFSVELPASPANRLVLRLPKRLTPIVESAIVAQEGSASDGTVRWSVDLGGRHRFRLRLVPSEDLDPARKLNVVRQSLAYEVSLRGIEVSAQWTLDVPCAPLRQVAVDLDPSLQLAAARCGGLPVSWRTAGGGGPGRSTRVVLELPEAIEGSGRVLRLGAVGPSVLDKRWRLPAMRAQGLFWQEGTATLIVPAPLTLEQLAVSGGRQTQAAPLPAPRSGQVAEFQLFSPDASIEVLLAKRDAPLEFDCGTALELSDVDMAAEVTAKFRVAEGERFQIDADVSRQWIIDSVETVPANALEDWTLRKGDSDSGRLAIRLAKAVCPSRPVKVVVQARHHYSPLGRVLAREDLVPIEFRGSPEGRRLVSIRAAEAYQLRPAGAERLTRVDTQNFTPADLELFDDPPKGFVFVNDAQAAGVRVALEPQKPSYSATIQVEATATDAGLSESYLIRCSPEAARVDRMLVQFSQAREIPLRWSFGSEDQDQVTVRPWKPSGHLAGGQAFRGESFEIAFRRPRSVPFEIRAARILTLAAPVSISLASLPEAARQDGTVAIGSTRTASVRIETHHVTPIPPTPSPGDQYSTVRATYRYDPDRDVGPGAETAVILASQEASPGTPWAWAWTCHVESHYQPGGTARHMVTYRLQNSGRSQILVGLPEELGVGAIRGVRVDGARVPWEPTPGGIGDWVAVPLPPGRKHPVVSVHLETVGASLGAFHSLRPACPELDVPVLQSYWTAWLPPGYEPAESGLSGQAPWRPAKTMSQRCFGPFGRPDHASRFQPLAVDEWAKWVGRSHELSLARQNAARFFERLGTRDGPSAPPAGVASPAGATEDGIWAERLIRASSRLQTSVLADRLALARAGVKCRGHVPKVDGETAADRGLAMMQRAGLALLISNDAALLTSAVEAARYHPYLAPAGPEAVWHVLPGPLADHLTLAVEKGRDSFFVPLETWASLPGQRDDPWTAIQMPGGNSAETTDWSAYLLELPSEQDTVLPIVHRETLGGLAWSSFLAVFAVLAWKGRRRPTLLVSLATWWAVLALVVPDVYTPLLSSALWATLAVIAMEGAARWDKAVAANLDSTAAPKRPAAAAIALVVSILTAWACTRCLPARADQTNGPTVNETYQVLIPVDDKQQPSGDKYYLPESFFSRLQAAASRSDDPRGWVLQSAVYRGALSWRTGPGDLALEDLRATFDLEVLRRQVRVRIPLGRLGGETLPDGITLEGRAVQPLWPDPNGNLAIDIADPGKYRLEVAMRPSIQVTDGKNLLQWKIPRVAVSRLELSVPRDAPGIEFPASLGAVVREADPSRILVALGPTDQLQIAWPEGAAPSAGGPTMDVEELLWLKIRPGSVVLDTLLNCKVLEGRVREVQLAVDPRLRYLPPRTETPSIAQASIVPGEPQLLRFQLPRPASDRLAIPASFLLQESSGVGSYRLPLVDVVGARKTKRWLALSVDPSLEYVPNGRERPQAVAVPAYTAAWGAAKSPPQVAWELSSPRPDWSVSTRPAPGRTKAEQVLTLSFAPRSAQVVLEAGVTVSAEPVFQHRIAAPPEIEVLGITLLENGADRVSRWSRAADGTITVFLNGASAGKQQLTLRGRLSTPEQGKLPLPIARLEAEAAKPMEIALFRESAVQVQVSGAAGLAETEAPAVDESRASSGRLVKAFQVQAGTVEATLRIAPNRPRIRAEQITRIRGGPETWEAEDEFRFHIAGGVADQFRFAVPPQWTGPYKVHPPAGLKVVDVPGKPQRQLVIRPRFAVEGPYRLSVSGPLTLGANERPAAVKIVPEEVDVTKHLVILPLATQVPLANWEIRGLIPTKLPDDLSVTPADRTSLSAYRAVGSDYQAVLRVGGQEHGKPQIDLADVRIAWQLDGTFHAVAAFDLEPAGLDSCPIALPPECSLVQVLVGGQTSVVASLGENRWNVPLESTTLPQRIEVVYVGRVFEPGGAGLHVFAVPAPGEIPVRQSVWVVSAPSAYRLRADEPGLELTPLQHALTELRSLASIVERAAEIPGMDPEPLERWCRDWARRWMAARTAVVGQLLWAEAAKEAASARAELESLEKREATASERLGLSGLFSQVAADRMPSAEPAVLWRSAQDDRRRTVLFGTSSAFSPVTVVHQPVGSSDALSRLMVLLGVSLLGAAAIWGTRRGILPKFFARWPYVAGTLGGLAWWWWLRPSVLGFSIALLSVVAAASSLWRRRRAAPTTLTPLPP